VACLGRAAELWTSGQRHDVTCHSQAHKGEGEGHCRLLSGENEGGGKRILGRFMIQIGD
jgi:hypothetical protein